MERESRTWLLQYFKAPLPMGVFSYGLALPPHSLWLANERLKLISAWMAAQPADRALPHSAVKAIEDQER